MLANILIFTYDFSKGISLYKTERKEDCMSKKQMVTVSIRLDAELKKRMEDLCDELGITMASAYTVFTKKCVREHGLPFKLTADPFYSEANMEFLRRGIQALNEGKGIDFNPFDTKEE